MLRNPKTTISGILLALLAIFNAAQLLLDGDPTTNPDWNEVAYAIIGSIGLLFAKDFNVSGTGK